MTFPWSNFVLNYTSKTTHCVKSVQIRSFFWSVFSRIRTEYREILSIYPYSVPMRENADQKKLRIWTIFTRWHSQKLSIFSGQPLLILLHQKVQAIEIVPNLFTKRTAWKTSSTSEFYSGPCQTYLIKLFWKQLMALAIYFYKTQKTFFLAKVSNRNSMQRCEICSKLTKKKPERRQRLLLF